MKKNDVIGIIPAAGLGTRVPYLPCSKEIFPIGLTDGIKPKPVALYLMERMMKTGLNRIFFIVSKNKWDIPRYFGNGSEFGVALAYLVQEKINGMPGALDLVSDWLSDETVLFGMPDTIFYPEDAFVQMLVYHNEVKADLTLGLFPTNTPERFGMVKFDAQRALTFTVDKPKETDLEYMWGAACWNKGFQTFLNSKFEELDTDKAELVIGAFFQEASESGLDVRVVPFPEGKYIDIGAPESLVTTIKTYSR